MADRRRASGDRDQAHGKVERFAESVTLSLIRDSVTVSAYVTTTEVTSACARILVTAPERNER